MDLRPRWSLHYQITLMAVCVTVVAVVVVGRLTEREGKKTLMDHEIVDLRDDTNLRVNEIQSELADLGRGLRDFAAKAQGTPNGPPPNGREPIFGGTHPVKSLSEALTRDEPAFRAWWDAGLATTLIRPRNPTEDAIGQHFDGTAIEWVLAFDPKSKGAVLVGGSAVREGKAEKFGPAASPGGEVLARLVQETAAGDRAHPIAEASPFVLEEENGHKVCRLYLARRVFTRRDTRAKDEEGKPVYEFPASIGVVVVVVNVTRYLDDRARWLPRHVIYLVDGNGRYLYHPDPTRTGEVAAGDDPLAYFFRSRPGADSPLAADKQLAFSGGETIHADREGVVPPGVHYFHAKKDLPLSDGDTKKRDELCQQFNDEMRAFARAQEQAAGRVVFRYSELDSSASRVEISHQTRDGLEQAKKKIDELVSKWPSRKASLWTRTQRTVLGVFGGPGTGWYETLDCTNFVVTCLLLDPGLGSGPIDSPRPAPTAVGGYVPPPGSPRFVSAAAVGEIEQDAAVVTGPLTTFIAVVVCIVAAGLAFGLSLYVTRPLHRIGEAAHTLGVGAKQVAETEDDQTKSGERFAVDLPSAGPREVMEVVTAFQEMVLQLERMTVRLRRRNAEMQSVLRTAIDGIVLFNERGEIETANAAAETMFGYNPGELVGYKVQRLVQLPPDSPLRLDLPGRQPGSTGSLTDGRHSLGELIRLAGVEMRASRKDGTEFWAEAGFNEVSLGDRVIYTGIVRDVTERKRAEDEIRSMNAELDRRVKERTALLVEANDRLEVALAQAKAAGRAKDTFVANMSHELRQPLNTVIGYAELLREEAADGGDEGIVQHLDKILTAARHLLGLINDILDLAKIADEKLELTVKEFEVRRLVSDLFTLAEPLSKKNANTLVFPPPGDLGRMTGDELRVRQALLNLLSNACKFTQKGTITLSVAREAGPDASEWVRFAVKDTGKGMTKEQAGRLFQRFYQADDSTRREQGGTGLGLAITRSLGELMGGEVSVTSEPGVGSEFVFRVPVKPPAPPKEPRKEPGSGPIAPPPPRPRAPRRSVLVIDDDASARELMKRFLEKDGFAVVTAATGEEGLQLAKAHHPDLITLDVMMPGVDGWATLAALKTDATTYSIPVVMVTMVDDRGRGFALGATDYLTKPVDWQKLGATLKTYIPQAATGPVLVVDDDPEHVDLVSRLLLKEGWEVVTAANGAEAVARVQERRPALILLDLMMPVMDGFGFLEELHKLNPQPPIPVIVVTAKDLSPDDIQRLNGGVAHVVQKGHPLSLDEILHRVRPGVPAGGPEGSHA
jgi:signal transduction histidine kinase/CheY-like chemotaxis protein